MIEKTPEQIDEQVKVFAPQLTSLIQGNPEVSIEAICGVMHGLFAKIVLESGFSYEEYCGFMMGAQQRFKRFWEENNSPSPQAKI